MALSNLFDLQLHNANETAFGVAEGSPTWRSLRTVGEVKANPDWQSFDDPTTRQRTEESYAKLLGLKNTTKLTFPVHLRGTGTAGTAGAKGAADLAECQMLKAAFGAESLGTGTTISDATASVTEFDVTSAAGLSIGQAVLVSCGGVLEANVIGNIATNTLTFVRAFSAVPSNGATVYASSTYYAAETLPGTLQFRSLDAAAASVYWQFLGCQPDLKFEGLNPGQLPRINYDALCASWTQQTGGSLAMVAHTHTVAPSVPGYASKLWINHVGTTTSNPVHYAECSMDPGLGVVGVPSGSGVMGLQGYARSASKPTMKLTVNEYAADWFTDHGSQQAYYAHLQIGQTAGGTVFIEVPNWTMDSPPDRKSVANAQLGSEVAGTGRGLGTTATDIARAPIRVHLL
jgi:hypothetical protein